MSIFHGNTRLTADAVDVSSDGTFNIGAGAIIIVGSNFYINNDDNAITVITSSSGTMFSFQRTGDSSASTAANEATTFTSANSFTQIETGGGVSGTAGTIPVFDTSDDGVGDSSVTVAAGVTTVTGDLTVTGTIGNPAASGSATFFIEDTGVTSAAGGFQFRIADSGDTGTAGFITFVRE